MAIVASNTGGGSGFKPVSEGLHQAVCIKVVDLGIQPGSDRYPKPKHKVYIAFACVDEQVEWEKDGEKKSGPAIAGSTYTLSLGENARLRPLLESWRGRKFTETELKGFDISKLAGVPAQVQIIHENRGEKVYANIAAIVPWPKGVPVPQTDPPVVYSPSEHDDKVYDSLPQWIREAIEKRVADNYAELDAKQTPRIPAAPVPPGPGYGDSFSDLDSDIPFLPCEYRSIA